MILRTISLVILLVLSKTCFSQTLVKLWSVSDGLKTPESVLFDPGTNCIYVSNIDGNPTEKDNNGFISLLSPEGTMTKLNWITGLNAPKGQAIFNGKLYVADIDELVVIDIKGSKIVDRMKIPKAQFLNDIAINDDGTIFISDTKGNKIYALHQGKVSVWLENRQIEGPNGLWVEKGQLYIGTNKLLQAEIKTKTIKILIENTGGIDGLEKMKDGNFIYSNWQGRIFVTKGSNPIQLLDTVNKLNTADIDFIPSKGIILVPTFSGNSVDAYLLKY